jgi:hypothetical protein
LNGKQVLLVVWAHWLEVLSRLWVLDEAEDSPLAGAGAWLQKVRIESATRLLGDNLFM